MCQTSDDVVSVSRPPRDVLKSRLHLISDKTLNISVSELRVLGLITVWPKNSKSNLFLLDNTLESIKWTLLTKDAELKWTAFCQEESDYLKECLMNEPILQPLNQCESLKI